MNKLEFSKKIKDISEEIEIQLTELDLYQKISNRNPTDKRVEEIPKVKGNIETLKKEMKEIEQEISSLKKKANNLLNIGFPELLPFVLSEQTLNNELIVTRRINEFENRKTIEGNNNITIGEWKEKKWALKR